MDQLNCPRSLEKNKHTQEKKREDGGSKTEIFVWQQNKPVEGHELDVGFNLLSLIGEVSVQI